MVQDIFKVKVWQVSITELEVILMQHPQILDVAVVGVLAVNSSNLDNNVPRAFVVRRPAWTDDFAGPTLVATTHDTTMLSQTQLLCEAESRTM